MRQHQSRSSPASLLVYLPPGKWCRSERCETVRLRVNLLLVHQCDDLRLRSLERLHFRYLCIHERCDFLVAIF